MPQRVKDVFHHKDEAFPHSQYHGSLLWIATSVLTVASHTQSSLELTFHCTLPFSPHPNFSPKSFLCLSSSLCAVSRKTRHAPNRLFISAESQSDRFSPDDGEASWFARFSLWSRLLLARLSGLADSSHTVFAECIYIHTHSVKK